MLIKPEIQKFARIKVVGVGGGGSNAVSSMIETQNIQGVEFVVINTDAQALSTSPASVKVQIGQEITGGLGSGGIPEVGRKAAEESVDAITEHLESSDMVFITAGMGGGTGTGAAPVVAEAARQAGALTVAVVTKPFDFEGVKRRVNAEEGLANLREKVDTMITIPNQRLLEVIDVNFPLIKAFRVADSVLGQSVQGISDIIVLPGLINRDFADIRAIMKDAGSALMGIGRAAGEDRAVSAAQNAIESPLLESSIEGAKGILFNITGGPDLTLAEVDKAAKIICAAADEDANIIFGATIDDEMGDELKLTVIATGFSGKKGEKKPGPPTETKRKDLAEQGLPSEDYDLPAFMRRK